MTTFEKQLKKDIMKFITLTSINGGKLYINTQHIGHFYSIDEKVAYGRVTKMAHTNLGVTTHNNGGFSVTETVEEIMRLINK